jgi:transcriptional regulator with XRE-family HTH domain
MTLNVAVADVLAEVRVTRSLPPPTMRRALREAAGLTQERLGSALGVSRIAICRWESGLREPCAKNRVAYAHLLAALAAEVNRS